MSDTRLEVSRIIRADADRIFEVLRNPRGHVDIDASGMLMSSTGEPVTGVGDTFTVHMDREALGDYPLGLYDVTIEITKFEQSRAIEWTVKGQIKPQIGHVYGYLISPQDDDSTLVTSYCDWSEIDPVWKDADIFPIISEGALKATLGILARTTQRDASDSL
jgi:hypothetical protein